MLEFISDNPWAYGLVGISLVTFAFGIWHVISEIREEARRYSELAHDLFDAVPQDEAIRNLRSPHSTVVGKVSIDGNSKVTLVLEGRDGLFIDQGKKAPWLKVPWNRIHRIDSESPKRITVYVKRQQRPPIALSLPWSNNMSLEHWDAYRADIE